MSERRTDCPAQETKVQPTVGEAQESTSRSSAESGKA